jgi:hypothetical protein
VRNHSVDDEAANFFFTFLDVFAVQIKQLLKNKKKK